MIFAHRNAHTRVPKTCSDGPRAISAGYATETHSRCNPPYLLLGRCIVKRLGRARSRHSPRRRGRMSLSCAILGLMLRGRMKFWSWRADHIHELCTSQERGVSDRCRQHCRFDAVFKAWVHSVLADVRTASCCRECWCRNFTRPSWDFKEESVACRLGIAVIQIMSESIQTQRRMMGCWCQIPLLRMSRDALVAGSARPSYIGQLRRANATLRSFITRLDCVL